MSSELLEVAYCMDSKAEAEAQKCVKPGFQTLKVRVALADVSQATLEQLARLGFKVTLRPTTARLVYGELPAAKLAELAALKEVLFVTRAEPMK